MADEILAFGGFEAAEQQESSSTKGSSGQIIALTKDGSTSTCAIVTTPTLAGSFALEVDPVNGQSATDAYGGQILGLGSTTFIIIAFIWRFAAVFDDEVSICERHQDTSTKGRRLILDTAEKLQIQDKDGDQIGAGSNALAVNTNYPILWYMNLFGTTRDIVWVYGLVTPGVWSKEVDVSGHGDPGNGGIITLGSGTGKTLPTSGGPMYYDQFAIIRNPTSSGVGSIAGKFLKANGNGADTGEWVDHAFGDVDEVPADLDGTTIDSANASGEKQSYDVEAPGETPLAMFPSGCGRVSASGASISAKSYIFDGTNRDFMDTDTISTAFETISRGVAKRTLPDGNPITESAINDIEVGIELTARTNHDYQLDQIGLEYCVAGAVGLPSDFPTDVGTGEEVLGPIFIT